MAIEQATPRSQAPQSKQDFTAIVEALKLSCDVMNLAADAADEAQQRFQAQHVKLFDDLDRAEEERQLMVAAVRSLPAATVEQALTKLAALNAATDAHLSTQALARNHALFVADVSRLIEAGQ